MDEGEEVACRLGAWNGYDQSTMEGLQRARELRRNMRPHDQLGRNALRAVVFARKHESVDTRSADKA